MGGRCDMGVDIYVLKFLLACRQRGVHFGRVLQLGRQGFYVQPHERPIVEALLAEAGLAKEASALMHSPYCEGLFSILGASRINSIDISRYEMATFIHDFNEPIPNAFHNKFDTLFDGGSLEHIFNIPLALRNLMQVVKLGGVILSVNGANNFLGHGFFQFSPELMYRVFCKENGFSCKSFLMSLDGNPVLHPTLDPADQKTRLEIGSTDFRTYLMVIARKIEAVDIFGSWPQQSDYKPLWEESSVLRGEPHSPLCID